MCRPRTIGGSLLPPPRVWLPSLGMGVIIGGLHLIDRQAGAIAYLVATTGIASLVGLLVLAERQRYHHGRREVLDEARAMLKDRINNQLQIVMAELAQCKNAIDPECLSEVTMAIYGASRMLDELDHHHLGRWRSEVPRTR